MAVSRRSTACARIDFLEKSLWKVRTWKKDDLLYRPRQPPFRPPSTSRRRGCEGPRPNSRTTTFAWRALELRKGILHHQLLHQQPTISFQTAVGMAGSPVETCCQTLWGALPDASTATMARRFMI